MLFYLMIAFTLCGIMTLAPQMATPSYAAQEGGSIHWTYQFDNGYTLVFDGTITGFDKNGVPHGTGTLTIIDPNGHKTVIHDVPFSYTGFDATDNPALANFLQEHPSVNQAFIVWLLSTY